MIAAFLPAAAIGKTLNFTLGAGKNMTVVGVVEDSRFRSVRERVLPMVFLFDRNQLPVLLLRFEETNPRGLRKQVETVWRRFAPHAPIDAEFSEDVLQNLYEAEEARGQLFAAFAAIAVVISSIGLFGLAAFSAERRTKEIGIRKVLGARVRDIVKLLVWQFSKPVTLANLIAWPAAWWVMRDWLNTFDARIPLTPAPFVISGALALALAVGTIAGHAVKVGRTAPIKALRYE